MRPVRPLLLGLVLSSLLAPPAGAAGLDGPGTAELKRGFAAAELKASVEPALRAERQAGREPTLAFLAGAALGAWINAAAQLDFDLKNPSGDGDDTEAIAADCHDETRAFDQVEAGGRALALAPDQALGALGAAGETIAALRALPWGGQG